MLTARPVRSPGSAVPGGVPVYPVSDALTDLSSQPSPSLASRRGLLLERLEWRTNRMLEEMHRRSQVRARLRPG